VVCACMCVYLVGAFSAHVWNITEQLASANSPIGTAATAIAAAVAAEAPAAARFRSMSRIASALSHPASMPLIAACSSAWE
jgi:hypothetical protein